MINKKLINLLKLRNKALVITDKTVAVKGGSVIQTDLNTKIMIHDVCPQIPDGVYNLDEFKVGLLQKQFEISEYPSSFGEVKDPKYFSVNSDVLKRVSEFCGKVTFRPQFDYVDFRNGNMYATDAHKLIRIQDAAPKDIKFSIHKDIVKMLPKNAEIRVSVGEHLECSLNFSIEDVVIEIYFRKFDGKPIDYDSVIPDMDKRNSSFDISTREINWAALKHISDKICFKSTDNDEFYILSEDIKSGEQYKQVPMMTELTQEPFEIAFNIDYFKTCVGKSPFCEVRFDNGNTNRPANILTKEKEDIVLMPFRVFQN